MSIFGFSFIDLKKNKLFNLDHNGLICFFEFENLLR
jgi:hypothetical protein